MEKRLDISLQFHCDEAPLFIKVQRRPFAIDFLWVTLMITGSDYHAKRTALIRKMAVDGKKVCSVFGKDCTRDECNR